MALAATSIIEIQSAATAANVNGGGFNPANANMLTDLTTDSNTANTASPVCSSASYNFVAGDVGNWLYIKSGTNWTPGWYQIASVASNKATLSAAIGAGILMDANEDFIVSTAAGCATVGTPTNGTFTIDYSQSTACITSTAVSDYASTGSSTTMTSATAAFTPVMVGNFFHLNNAGTGGFGVVGWYEIVSYTNGTTVVTDRTTNSGTAMVAGQGKIGGALSLADASDDAVFELVVGTANVGGTKWFIKGNATYTIGGAISIAADGNTTWQCPVEGYASRRGDKPTGSTRPILAMGANAFLSNGNEFRWKNLIMTTTEAGGFVFTGSRQDLISCKVTNISTSADRIAIGSGAQGLIAGCEIICYRGIGISCGATFRTLYGNYIHDCNVGVNSLTTDTSPKIFNNIISSCYTTALNIAVAVANHWVVIGNTFYGAENKLGIGINLVTGCRRLTLFNNIFYGYTTGIVSADVSNSDNANYNNFYNNTTNRTSWKGGLNDLAVDPTFTSITQRTGSTATTTAGNHLVQTGATFTTWGVTAGTHYLIIKSGTGVTAGIYGITSVDSETQITTDVTLSADATADKTWQIVTGLNWAVGTNLKAVGFPSAFSGSSTTGYQDIGAAQRQEAGSGAGGGIFNSSIIRAA